MKATMSKKPAQPRIRLRSEQERQLIEIYRCSSVKVRAALLTLAYYCDGTAGEDAKDGA